MWCYHKVGTLEITQLAIKTFGEMEESVISDDTFVVDQTQPFIIKMARADDQGNVEVVATDTFNYVVTLNGLNILRLD